MDVQKLKKKKDRAKAEGNVDNEYFACKQLAEVYFSSEKYDLALSEYKEMERISERLNNMVDVGRANRMIGEVYCEKGEFDKAISHQMKHLVLSREAENRVEEQRALATLGRTYFLKAESFPDANSESRVEALIRAKDFYKESLAICNSLSESDVGQRQKMEMISRLFLNIGLVFDCRNQYESAIDYIQKATSICKKLDLWEDLYRSYLALGGAYHRHQDFNQSIRTYDLAVSVAERLSNKQTLISDVLLLKADVLLDLPDMRGARQALLRAYKLKPSSHLLQVELEKKLRLVAALCECEEKLSEMRLEGDDSERRKLYEEMGDAASELSNFKLALVYYHLMLECVEKCGNEKKALIDAYISLAQTYKDDHQYSKSLEFFKKELQLEEPNSPEACKTLLNIAEVYQLMGLKDEMFQAYNEAKDIAMKLLDVKLKKTVLSSLHSALVEGMQHGDAEVVQRELNSLSTGSIDDSTDDDEDTQPRMFGLHIDLDQLTDEECAEGSKEAEDRKRHDNRSRPKRSRNPNIEKRNEKGETPLHVAAIQGNITHALKLLEQGHRVDVKDNSGWTPLHEACNHGHIEVVRALLEHGAPVNDRGGPHCDGVTPLLDAASNGNLDVIHVLLDHGASPLMRTNSGESVIDCLSGWRRRRYDELGVDISGHTLAQYKTIYKKLGQMLEKAGQRFSDSDESLLEKEATSVNHSPPRLNRPQHSSSQTHKSSEKKSSDKRRNAACEYENAMRSLRFRTNTFDESMSSERSVKVKDGLIPQDESIDDWLEDDMPLNRPSKKLKLSYSHHVATNRRNTSPPHFQKEEEEVEEDEENTETTEEGDIRPSHPSLEDEGGGARDGEAGPSNDSSRRRSQDEKVVRVEDKPVSNASNYSCVRVSIEGKVVIVPVPLHSYATRTIAWLASEAAQRYKSLEGMEPVVQLEMDGGLLVGSDPLSIVNPSPTTVLLARVQSWKHTSLSSLYQEACRPLNQSVSEELLDCTEECERTGRLSMSDMYVSWLRLEPLIKAVTRYPSLTVLSLASASLPASSIIDVAESLSKLPNLMELDLSNTNITEKELETIGKVVKKNRGFQRLEVLDVSYNPVRDWSFELECLLESCLSLRQLSIAAHDVSSTSISLSKQFSLERLIASYNELGSEGAANLLAGIDWRRLQQLELAGCGDNVLPAVARFLDQHPSPNLVFIDLSYLPYSPQDLTLLAKGTGDRRNLTKILLDSEDAYSIERLTSRVEGITLPPTPQLSAPYSLRISVP